MKLVLPMPPSANLYWRNFRGRTVVSEEARAYKERVKWLALQQLPRPLRPLTGPVILSLAVYKLRRNADLSNRIKVLEDAIQGVLFEDDSQVCELYARRFDEADEARVVVSVEEQR